jgi:secondary thiamine-phosphate synthase enzyme
MALAANDGEGLSLSIFRITQTELFSERTMTYQDELRIETSGHGDMHDVTRDVASIVAASKIMIGTAHIHVIGSTGAVGTIEYEPGLERDLPEIMDSLMPPGRHYGHEMAWQDGNAHSHLQATTLGPSISVPFSGGELLLGTWQQVFFLECDIRPRRRTLVITVTGD